MQIEGWTIYYTKQDDKHIHYTLLDKKMKTIICENEFAELIYHGNDRHMTCHMNMDVDYSSFDIRDRKNDTALYFTDGVIEYIEEEELMDTIKFDITKPFKRKINNWDIEYSIIRNKPKVTIFYLEEGEEMETEQKQLTVEDIAIKPIKDSGKRYTNEHGGMRDTSEGKPKFKYIDASFLDKVTEADALYIDYENMVYEISYEKVLDAISFKDPDHNQYCRYEIIMIATSILLVCVEDESWSQQSLYEGLSKFALFMEEGAKKYSFENWKLLNTPEDIERFKESCYRHYIQWRLEEDDENHQMATVFNLMALFYHLKEKKPIMNLADFIKQPYVQCYE